MAYCDRCGAYIPDGQEACLACGYDPEEENRQAKRAAAAQVQRERQERFEREEAERRRAERQAYDKAWAENEQRRRQQEEESRRQMQEEAERRRAERQAYDKTWAENEHRRRREEEDFRKRQQEAEERAKSYINIGGNMAEETLNKVSGRILPLISYLGPLCILSLILGNDDFTRFHAKQGLRLFIWSAILTGVGSFFHIGFAVGIFQVLMAIIGIKNVVNGEEKKLPYIGG